MHLALHGTLLTLGWFGRGERSCEGCGAPHIQIGLLPKGPPKARIIIGLTNPASTSSATAAYRRREHPRDMHLFCT
jgi:hypothetical protein